LSRSGAVADYYRKTGQIDKALEFDDRMRRAQALDLQLKAAQNQLSDYDRRLASEQAAADQLKYLDQVQAARSSGALGNLFNELKQKVASGEITPEQYNAALAQIQTRKYRPIDWFDR